MHYLVLAYLGRNFSLDFSLLLSFTNRLKLIILFNPFFYIKCVNGVWIYFSSIYFNECAAVKVQVNRRCPESDIRARGSSCGTRETLSSFSGALPRAATLVSPWRGQKQALLSSSIVSKSQETFRAHQPVPSVSLFFIYHTQQKIKSLSHALLMDSLSVFFRC